MEFDGFDWDDGNRDKCQKHGVSIGEIERLFERTGLNRAGRRALVGRKAVSGDRRQSEGPPRFPCVHLADEERAAVPAAD